MVAVTSTPARPFQFIAQVRPSAQTRTLVLRPPHRPLSVVTTIIPDACPCQPLRDVRNGCGTRIPLACEVADHVRICRLGRRASIRSCALRILDAATIFHRLGDLARVLHARS